MGPRYVSKAVSVADAHQNCGANPWLSDDAPLITDQADIPPQMPTSSSYLLPSYILDFMLSHL